VGKTAGENTHDEFKFLCKLNVTNELFIYMCVRPINRLTFILQFLLIDLEVDVPLIHQNIIT
jgi:hypothetical protein